ncbi:xylose isomerase [Sulfodiicoccus acidiphilus]|uniref:Xylose isomerase n=1 Tax=Sulfodiicoccus acidiphilus TaxID=1670455 RepID=A0A348B550_9CREN|nr:sugar phosphate isomerase/epimerase [Sulfodiicoccus acidiphilus]BBD73302.1 xylose isomerase [Sulfodiicoccus acidiphilus]GGT89257.1 xylose isomerase [Sulfodiicoccus acidiphilus]
MRIGVFTVLFRGMKFEEMLDEVVKLGLEAVEIGCGNYPGNEFCDPSRLLKEPERAKQLAKAVEERGLVISALSCHGNPLHPNREVAEAHRRIQRDTVTLAQLMGVDRVNTFSGCPGDSEDAKYPNWVVSPWPDDFQKVLEWQWKEKVVPFWKGEADFAERHGVKIALEMHPGFVVYNPGTLLRLRKEVGKAVGANLDPSHLFWQGIDVIAAIRALGDAIYHVHAKDTYVDPLNVNVNGVLDPKSYRNLRERSWYFRTVGYGHGPEFWAQFVSELRLNGYDHVLSIEHEDAFTSPEEGLRKAIQLLKQVQLKERPGEAWWA